MHPHAKAAMALAARVFRLKILRRSQSYKRVFDLAGDNGRDVEIVLADLRNFCRAAESTFDADPIKSARLQGRREAWLRFSQHLNLDEATVQKLVEIDDGLGD